MHINTICLVSISTFEFILTRKCISSSYIYVWPSLVNELFEPREMLIVNCKVSQSMRQHLNLSISIAITMKRCTHVVTCELVSMCRGRGCAIFILLLLTWPNAFFRGDKWNNYFQISVQKRKSSKKCHCFLTLERPKFKSQEEKEVPFF